MDRMIARPDDVDHGAIQSSPTSMPRIKLGGSLLSIAAVAALFIGVINLHHGGPRVLPGELVFPVPPDVYAAAIFVATFIIVLLVGCIFARGRSTTPSRSTQSVGSGVLGLVSAAILIVSALCCLARTLTQVVGFSGLHPAAVPAPFDVVDTDWYSRKSSVRRYYLLRLRYGPAGRTFDDEMSKAVYDAARQGDTVPIPVETGRFGLTRAMIDATPLVPGDLHHATTPNP